MFLVTRIFNGKSSRQHIGRIGDLINSEINKMLKYVKFEGGPIFMSFIIHVSQIVCQLWQQTISLTSKYGLYQ